MTTENESLVPTGTAAFDEVLGGGFSPGSLVVFAGSPGTGKTILAQQIVFHNATEERPGLYYTTLSESHSKMVRHLQPFDFFDRHALGGAVSFLHITELIQGAATDGERGLEALVEEIVDTAFERHPSFVVLDSSKALHHFADPQRLREVIFSLASRVSHTGSVLLLVGEYTRAELDEAPEFAVADAIVHLEVSREGPAARRSLRVLKLRGRNYLAGQHTFEIGTGGIEVYPRLETTAPTRAPDPGGRHRFDIDVIDEMTSGGLPGGEATLVMGPTGSGKTVLGTHFVGAGLRTGERAVYVSMEETVAELVRKGDALGLAIAEACDRGDLEILFVPPMELEIDRLGGQLMRTIERVQPQRIVFDGLGDLIPETQDTGRFPSYLWALMSTLRVTGASVVFTYEVTALGAGHTRLDALSYLFHNVLVLRYMERGSELGRVLNVLKMRSSDHAKGLLQFEITSDGFTPIGQPGDVSATLGWNVVGRATGD